MSLINEALKKAQKQRTSEASVPAALPGIGGEPAAKIARRAKPAGFNTLLLRIGLIGGGVVVILVGGLLGLRLLRSRPAPATASPVAAAPTASHPQAVAKSAAAGSPADAFAFKLPEAPAPTIQSPATPATVASSDVAIKPVVEIAPSPAPAPAPAIASGPPQMSDQAVAFIENLHISGIRASPTDAKVLMNDRVYRSGDVVQRDLGLKLVNITASSLEFENAQGARYVRNF